MILRPSKSQLKAQQLVEAFTRQHYEAIAKILKSAHIGEDAATKKNILKIAEDLAWLFKSDNPHFDKARFLKACGF